MKNLFVLTIVGTVDPDVGVNDMKAFADEALSSMGGCRHPDDLLFESMDVKHIKAIKIGRVE